VIDLRDLPQSAVDLINLIGLTAALRLVKTWPGHPFPVPKGENNNPEGAALFAALADIVGQDNARILVRVYGGTILYIPRCKVAMTRALHRQIASDYDARLKSGEPHSSIISALALAHFFTTRWVEIILKSTDTTDPSEAFQADLFT
jgi:hypothetical protein